MRIILASESAARKRAMKSLSLPFEVIPANIDERSIRHEDPYRLVEILAIKKAQALGREKDALIIAADMFCVHNDKIYEKPDDLAHAKAMLRELSANTFQIISGQCVLNTNTNEIRSSVSILNTTFRELSDEEIDRYCKNHPVLTYSAGFNGDGNMLFCKEVQGANLGEAGMDMNEIAKFMNELSNKN